MCGDIGTHNPATSEQSFCDWETEAFSNRRRYQRCAVSIAPLQSRLSKAFEKVNRAIEACITNELLNPPALRPSNPDDNQPRGRTNRSGAQQPFKSPDEQR